MQLFRHQHQTGLLLGIGPCNKAQKFHRVENPEPDTKVEALLRLHFYTINIRHGGLHNALQNQGLICGILHNLRSFRVVVLLCCPAICVTVGIDRW